MEICIHIVKFVCLSKKHTVSFTYAQCSNSRFSLFGNMHRVMCIYITTSCSTYAMMACDLSVLHCVARLRSDTRVQRNAKHYAIL